MLLLYKFEKVLWKNHVVFAGIWILKYLNFYILKYLNIKLFKYLNYLLALGIYNDLNGSWKGEIEQQLN